jgi:hypothetical protein
MPRFRLGTERSQPRDESRGWQIDGGVLQQAADGRRQPLRRSTCPASEAARLGRIPAAARCSRRRSGNSSTVCPDLETRPALAPTGMQMWRYDEQNRGVLLSPADWLSLDKEHPLQPAFPELFAEDTERAIGDQYQQHDDVAG